MAVTHSTAARNAANDAVTGLLNPSGLLVFRLSGTIGAPGAAVATCALNATAFVASASGTSTANAITSDTAAVGSTATVANASLQTSAGTLHIHCAVAAAASDINMTNGLVVASGDTVSCSSLTYTAMSA